MRGEKGRKERKNGEFVQIMYFLCRQAKERMGKPSGYIVSIL